LGAIALLATGCGRAPATSGQPPTSAPAVTQPPSTSAAPPSVGTTERAPTEPARPRAAARPRSGAGGVDPAQPAAAAPPIHQWPIPYGPARRRQMAEYSLRHYGEDTYELRDPRVIVEHFTETSTAQEAFDTFAADVPDSEFHELPNTCAHFLVEPDGRIDQLVALRLRCRHTTGLNWTAIGIENVGLSDREILGDAAQLSASLQLTRWLRCRFHVALADVIGHNESLSSPYHHDLVPAFQHQTHSDWSRPDMDVYRGQLAQRHC
jgi:beta-N-acetylhexosaminidase